MIKSNSFDILSDSVWFNIAQARHGTSCDASLVNYDNKDSYECYNAIDGRLDFFGYMTRISQPVEVWIYLNFGTLYTLTYARIMNSADVRHSCKRLNMTFGDGSYMEVCTLSN